MPEHKHNITIDDCLKIAIGIAIGLCEDQLKAEREAADTTIADLKALCSSYEEQIAKLTMENTALMHNFNHYKDLHQLERSTAAKRKQRLNAIASIANTGD